MQAARKPTFPATPALELADLRFLVELAQSGSLTLAAVKLELTQAAASRKLAALESLLGGRLFNRTGRGITPTTLGEQVLPEARSALAHVERLQRDALRQSGRLSGEVRLGVLPSISRKLVPHVFQEQRRHWPDVKLHVHEGFTGDLDEGLKSGALDLAVLNRYGPTPAATEFFLGHVDLVLVAANGDRVTAAREVAFRSLAGLPLVMPPAPNALRVVLDQQARSQRVAIVELLTADSLPLLIQLAIRERCYTIVPENFVADEVAAGQFQASRIVEPVMRRAMSLGLSAKRPSTAAVLEIARTIREFFGD